MKTRSCSVDPETPPTVLGRWLLLFFWLTAAGLPARAAQFQDVTTTAGLTNVTGFCLGAGWGDYDNDGRIDLFITTGATSVRTNALFRNNGDGTFNRQGAEVGPVATDRLDSCACAWIDFNNDGWTDLLALNGGWSSNPNTLYWNSRNGTFGRGGSGGLIEVSAFHSWVACADYDIDGLVDVFVGEAASFWGPFNPRFYRGSSSGEFTLDPRPALPVMGFINDEAWGDYDNDGDADLFTCGYTSESVIWRNEGNGQFTRMPEALSAGQEVVHAAWADFDNDGDLDIMLGAITANRLFRNEGLDRFVAVTNLTARIGPPAWMDYDNDGHIDLLVSVGMDTPGKPGLYHNNGDGTFSSVSDVFTEVADNWLCYPWGDYDNDGFMDVVMTHQFGKNRLYRNLGNTNHWLKFKLVGTSSNRDAIGAKIRLQATIGAKMFWQMQELNSGLLAPNDTRLNFGLGDATSAEVVRIEWPSGIVQELEDVAANQIVKVTEPARLVPQSKGGFQIQCWTGQSFEVHASTDLIQWTPVATVTNETGTLVFEDVDADQHDCRYYRVTEPR